MADIEKLLSRVDLLELAEKAGARFNRYSDQNARAACPLHGGKNPTAFSVYRNGADYPFWHCHTDCGCGGDAIDFYQRWRKVDFPTAVRDLSEMYHVSLDEIGWGEHDAAAEQERRKRAEVRNLAAQYYHQQLKRCKTALGYILSRGFTRKTIRAAKFGYSDSGTGLRDWLHANGADLSIARDIGLIRADGRDFTANAQGQKAAPNGWIIFTHVYGERVIYLSSRAVEVPGVERPEPKDKSRNLPGEKVIYKAEVDKCASLTLVEGQADAESVRQLGFTAWALCGLTKLPDYEIARLAKHELVYLAVDSDSVGQQSINEKTGRIVNLVSAIGPLTMIVYRPGQGKDFNDWLQNGATAAQLAELHRHATTWIEHRMNQAAKCPPHELDERMTEIGLLMAKLPESSQPRYFIKAREILGLTRRDINELIRTATTANNDDVLSSIRDGKLCFLGRPLGNFVARISHELMLDDGQNPPRVQYTVSGKLAAGTPLESIDVDAEEFDGLRWIPRYWGARPVIYVSRGQYHEIARAIQEVSLETIKRERVYTYTGWTEIDGKRVYLSGSGGLSGEKLDPDTRVELGVNNLRFYTLPTPTTGDGLQKATQASIDFLKLGPRTVTAPLWAAMYGAPLTQIAPLYAVMWVYGPTQSGKSTVTHLALTHFGTGFIQGRQYHAPIDWTSTATALEGAMFSVKDAPIVIDDFAPQFASAADSRDMHRKAHYVVRSVGNRSSRGRAKADLTERTVRVPRGLVIATAENPLIGQSTVGRMLYISIERGDILPSDGEAVKPALIAAQEAGTSGLYGQAMSAYLQWLANNWERVNDVLPSLIEEAAAAARKYQALQNRLPDYYGLLSACQQLAFMAFMELGLVSGIEAAKHVELNNQAILEVVTQQAEKIAAESPVKKFFEALSSLLARRKVFLSPRTQEAEYTPPAHAELIGWFDWNDSNVVYLDTDHCLIQAKSFWRDLDENLDIMPDALKRQIATIPDLLRERGADGKHIETSKWIAGKTRRALAVSTAKVSALFGVDISNESNNPGSDPNEEIAF